MNNSNRIIVLNFHWFGNSLNETMNDLHLDSNLDDKGIKALLAYVYELIIKEDSNFFNDISEKVKLDIINGRILRICSECLTVDDKFFRNLRKGDVISPTCFIATKKGKDLCDFNREVFEALLKVLKYSSFKLKRIFWFDINSVELYLKDIYLEVDDDFDRLNKLRKSLYL